MQFEATAIGLSAGAAVAAGLGILGHYAARRLLVYTFRPLAGVLILVLALTGDPAQEPRYYWAIAGGLLLALIGDLLLMAPGDLFVYGLLAFAGTHVCFLVALTEGVGLATHAVPFVVFALVAVAIVPSIWKGVGGPLRIPVVVYVTLLVSMGSQAWSRHLDLGLATSLCAAVGAALFVSSDAVLAVDRFRKPLRSARLVVLATFYAADGLIALSVPR